MVNAVDVLNQTQNKPLPPILSQPGIQNIVESFTEFKVQRDKMVIKVPVTPVSRLTDQEMFEFELSYDPELSRQFVNNLNHRRNAMNQVAQARWMKDQDIIKYAVDFLLKNLKSFHIYEYPDSKTAKFKYKVTRTWMMKKMNKLDLLERLCF